MVNIFYKPLIMCVFIFILCLGYWFDVPACVGANDQDVYVHPPME
jgi:hypothetical protein